MLDSAELQLHLFIQELQLQDEYQKFHSTNPGLDRLKVVEHRASYPFRKSMLTKIEEAVDEIRDNLSIVLQA